MCRYSPTYVLYAVYTTSSSHVHCVSMNLPHICASRRFTPPHTQHVSVCMYNIPLVATSALCAVTSVAMNVCQTNIFDSIHLSDAYKKSNTHHWFRVAFAYVRTKRLASRQEKPGRTIEHDVDVCPCYKLARARPTVYYMYTENHLRSILYMCHPSCRVSQTGYAHTFLHKISI